jgi:hypothetical protein
MYNVHARPTLHPLRVPFAFPRHPPPTQRGEKGNEAHDMGAL